jgi:nucleoside 2-deoxyribosyltransferase
MNIYFACPVIGARDDEEIYRAIVDTLIADGHEVPTAIIAQPEVVILEKCANPAEIYATAIERIERCHVVIAEVSNPSLGVGFEIAYALDLGKPVFCCYRLGRTVSKMITGNSNPRIMVHSYQDIQEAIGLVRAFVSCSMPS